MLPFRLFRLHDRIIERNFSKSRGRYPEKQVSVEVVCAPEGLNEAYAIALRENKEYHTEIDLYVKGDCSIYFVTFPVNSSSKCTTSSLTEDLMRCLVVETLSEPISKFIDDKSNFFFGDIFQIGSFGEVLS